MAHSEPIPDLTPRELRRFGLMTGAIVGVLFGLLLPWLHDTGFVAWPWVVTVVLVAWALIAPATLRGIHRVWMRIGAALGYINSRIILSVVFFLIFTPIAAVMRLFGSDPLSLRPKGSPASYRKQSEQPPRERMEKPY